MNPLSTILIITGIVTLYLWIMNLGNHIQPDTKTKVNLVAFVGVTIWLLVEIIRRLL